MLVLLIRKGLIWIYIYRYQIVTEYFFFFFFFFKIYDKLDDCDFSSANIPSVNGDFPRSFLDKASVSQLILFTRILSHVNTFNDINIVLTVKILIQVYQHRKLWKTFLFFLLLLLSFFTNFECSQPIWLININLAWNTSAARHFWTRVLR